MNPPSRTIYGDGSGVLGVVATVLPLDGQQKITIVKPNDSTLVLRRRTELLRNVDYMETQIGRLAKMARDMRAEILLLTTE